MSERYEALLFDFDGVLVDSEPIHFDCWREVLRPIGIELDWTYYQRNFIGVSDRKMAGELALMASPPVSIDSVYALYGPKTEIFRGRMHTELPFAPGVVDLLRSLNGYRIGVVTSSRRTEVEPVLIAAGLNSLLHVAVFGDDVTRHKPDPEPYRQAATRLGIERALVIEDSVAGVASGRAAGFDVLQIPTPADTARLVSELLRLG